MRIRSCDYTQEQLDWLKAEYVRLPAKELTAAFNAKFGASRTECAIKGTMFRRGFEAGRSGFIQAGTSPWNKGKKGVNGKSDTVFKKGNFPHNTRPAQHERISKDGLIEIKVGERGKTFIAKHRWLWEQANGPVPAGMIVRFADCNNRNFAMDNLICVSRHLNLRLNATGYNETPQTFKPTKLLAEKLMVTAKERLRAQ